MAERKEVKHELYFDEEKDFMVIRVRGSFKLKDAIETTNTMDELGKNKGTFALLADLSEAPPNLDKDVRQLMRDLSKRMKMKKMAMIVPNPAVRIIGKIVASTMKNAEDTGFFKTEEEALNWLKEGE